MSRLNRVSLPDDPDPGVIHKPLRSRITSNYNISLSFFPYDQYVFKQLTQVKFIYQEF